MSSLQRLCFSLVLLAPSLAHAAVLEIPGPGTTSGIGVISGWKCEASGPLTVRFNEGDPIPLAYHNERGDTQGVCGDTDNGFVAIWNWGNLGDGEHTAVVYDNGVEFDSSTFSVVTTGEAFLEDASGTCTIPDFPAPGESTTFAWNQNTQHLELAGMNSDSATPTQQSAVQAASSGSQFALENPGTGLNYSGIGAISGWKCEASGPLTVRFDEGDPIPLAYHNERGDTQGVCGDTDNGFVAIWNWGNLGDGEHTAVVYDNGVEFARSTFQVATLGEAFVRGASGECSIHNFSAPDETTTFAWNEATQRLEMVGVKPTCTITKLDIGLRSSHLYDASADGTRMVFSSSDNPTGQNADGSGELFVYDVPAATLTQITDSFGAQFGGAHVRMSADGSRIAFVSTDNLTGQNADGSDELFVYDVPTATLTQATQLTESSEHITYRYQMSVDGSRFAFLSNTNLTGQNADGSNEIFLYDLPTATLTQVTHLDNPSSLSRPGLSANGTRMLFISSIDVYEEAGQLFSSRISVYDVPTDTFLKVFDVSSRNDGEFLSLSADGTRVAFTSGGNGKGPLNNDPWELFLYDVPTRTLTQLTQESIFEPSTTIIIRPPATRLTNILKYDSPQVYAIEGGFSLSADGARLAFRAPGPGRGKRGVELFLYDVPTSALTQITNTQTGTGTWMEGADIVAPYLSPDGSRIVFTTDNHRRTLLYDPLPQPLLSRFSIDAFIDVTGFPRPVGASSDFIFDQSNADGTRLFFHTRHDNYLATCQ